MSDLESPGKAEQEPGGGVAGRPGRVLIVLLLVLLYLLHNDFWNWGQPEFLFSIPLGLLYHLGLCLAATLLYWLLTLVAWPEHLESALRDEEH